MTRYSSRNRSAREMPVRRHPIFQVQHWKTSNEHSYHYSLCITFRSNPRTLTFYKITVKNDRRNFSQKFFFSFLLKSFLCWINCSLPFEIWRRSKSISTHLR
ncbi:EC1118_1L7_2399p [Saccharomyces cerevisiae EC1118]|uniref:EC1118_1L7_2399p n=1 Tax=Saccharomyces cerevisiae (strain Lalvin EC1118 / Prise de mousse) TaxID=643680 RepID=C8ZDX6_YEAS8|nr:EC1118_1L7_2399p [Saccharomyces cerevisiae EC1118]